MCPFGITVASLEHSNDKKSFQKLCEARLKQSQSRQTGPFRVLFASSRFLPALRARGSSCPLRAAGADEIEAGGPVCKTTSSARGKHLEGSCSPPFLPDHGP